MAGFQDDVAAGWFSTVPTAYPFLDLYNKLKATAKALSSWSQRSIGNISEQIQMTHEVITAGSQMQSYGFADRSRRKFWGWPPFNAP